MPKSVKEVLENLPKNLDEEPIPRFNTKAFVIYLGVGFVVGLICFSLLYLLL